jgi:hypothetical protein
MSLTSSKISQTLMQRSGTVQPCALSTAEMMAVKEEEATRTCGATPRRFSYAFSANA